MAAEAEAEAAVPAKCAPIIPWSGTLTARMLTLPRGQAFPHNTRLLLLLLLLLASG